MAALGILVGLPCRQHLLAMPLKRGNGLLETLAHKRGIVGGRDTERRGERRKRRAVGVVCGPGLLDDAGIRLRAGRFLALKQGLSHSKGVSNLLGLAGPVLAGLQRPQGGRQALARIGGVAHGFFDGAATLLHLGEDRWAIRCHGRVEAG